MQSNVLSVLTLASAASLLADGPASSAQGPVRLESLRVEGTQEAPWLAVAESSTRLGLSLRETPASVQLLDSASLRERGARDFVEALNAATGIVSGTTGGTPQTLSTRGFTNNAVRLLYDGVPAGSVSMTVRPTQVFNYDRVEILRGPAGVTSGEGAIGGTINFVTKTPQLADAPVEVETSYGSFRSWRFGVGTNRVLARDRSALRVDFSASDTGFAAEGQRQETLQLTSGWRYVVSPHLSLSVQGDWSQDATDDYSWGTPLIQGRLVERLRHANYNRLKDDLFDAKNLWLRQHSDIRVGDEWTLRNSLWLFTSDREWRNAENYDYVESTGRVVRDSWGDLDHEQTSWGNRLTALQKSVWWGMPSRALLGAEYSATDFATARNGFPSAPQSLDAEHPLAGESFFNAPAIIPRAPAREVEQTTFALFGEHQLRLVAPLALVTGFRYDVLDFQWRYLDRAGQPVSQKTHHPLSLRGGLTYDLNATSTLYAQGSTAVEPGGTLWLLNPQQSQLDLTHGKAWEIGLKKALPAWHGDLTLSLYEIAKTNVFVPDPLRPADRIPVGKQSSRGFEVTGIVRPLAGWTLSSGVAYVDARFDRFTEGNPPVSRAGLVPPFVPEWVVNAGSRYEWGRGWSTGAYVRRVSEMFTNNPNTVQLPAYTTLDLDVRWQISARYTATLRVRNVTDALYATWAYRANQVTLGEPRTYELSLRAQF